MAPLYGVISVGLFPEYIDPSLCLKVYLDKQGNHQVRMNESFSLKRNEYFCHKIIQQPTCGYYVAKDK